MEGQAVVIGRSADPSAGAINPWDQTLSETDEISGSVGGVVLVELDGETAEFLVLQGDLEVSENLAPGGADQGEQEE